MNSGRLVRLILRRERVMSTVWIGILVLFSAALAPGMAGMFDAGARQQFAESFNNPVMIAMMGPVYGADNYTAGAMYGNMMLLWIIIAAAVMNIFLLVRHTRADEEKGRTEVVRSLPTGRLANLHAAMIAAAALNAVLALLTGLGLAAAGVESMDLAGSLLYGAVVGVSGLLFAAVAALFSQLSANKNGAAGLSFLAVGVFYLLRAAGDMKNEVLSLISPLGLAQRSRVYVENRWWPVWILLAETVVIAAAAYLLNTLRDLDQGFIHARPGRREASAALRSPFGLAFRLLRNTLIIWLIIMLILGASYGSIIGDIFKFVGDSPDYLTIIGVPPEVVENLPAAEKEKIVVEYFGVFVTAMMTLIGLVPLLTAAMKARGEEKEGRAEQVLIRPVPRGRYLAGYTALAFAASVLMPCAAAAGLYSAAAADGTNPFTVGGLLEAHLVYLPALWVMIGAAVLITGLAPRISGAVWGYYGFVCFVTLMGGIPGLLPGWLTALSPLRYIPRLPMEDVNYIVLAALTAVAAGLTVGGFVFYRRRDVGSS